MIKAIPEAKSGTETNGDRKVLFAIITSVFFTPIVSANTVVSVKNTPPEIMACFGLKFHFEISPVCFATYPKM